MSRCRWKNYEVSSLTPTEISNVFVKDVFDFCEQPSTKMSSPEIMRKPTLL